MVDNVKAYTLDVDGKTFYVRIAQPKAKRQFRGYLSSVTHEDLAGGRWDTVEEAMRALEAIAHKLAEPKR